jgi:hypothetical protein
MPQRASVFCNFYIRVDREALVSERAKRCFQGYEYKKHIGQMIRLLETTGQTPIFCGCKGVSTNSWGLSALFI